MRLVVTRKSLRPILRWTQRVLFACAVSMLGYVGFVLVDAWIFQKRENGRLERLLRDRRAASKRQPQTSSATPPEAGPAIIAPDGLIGRIEIPRLGLSAIVAEGTDKTTLRRAVGTIGQCGSRRAPRHVLPAVAKYTSQRHYYAHHLTRRVPLPRRVHASGGSNGSLGVVSHRK
jgi:hypothetical protein